MTNEMMYIVTLSEITLIVNYGGLIRTEYCSIPRIECLIRTALGLLHVADPQQLNGLSQMVETL